MLSYAITKHYGLAHNARKSNTRSSSPVYLTRAPRSPSTGNAYPYSGDPRYQPSPANPGSQPWRVSRWVMNSRPGVTLFTLTRIVGLAHPCRTRPCHLAFSRDFDTSHSRVVLPDTRIPWVASELMFLTRGIYLTRAFNIWKKIENLLSFYFLLLLLFSSKEYRIVKFNPLIFRFWLSITKFLILMIIKLL